MNLRISFVAAVLVLLFWSSQGVNMYTDLPYQAHGFNDLDYFLQMVKKGVEVFKFDVSLATEESCLSQSTWNHDNPCELILFGMETCCLGLRGDLSSSPIFEYPFNTSFDYTKMLQSGQYDYIFAKNTTIPKYQGKKIFAINFQYEYAINNMTQTFLYQLFKTINDRNLNIDIIFGRDSFITDFDALCLNSCTPEQQYIANFPVVLQSSATNLTGPAYAVKRIQNFNTGYTDAPNFCGTSFPSWINNYSYPIIFWEPSHENDMQYTFNTYYSPTCNRLPSRELISTVKFASNQDPEMNEVYLKGINKTLVGERYVFENRSNPYVEYFQQGDFLILSYLEGNQSLLVVADRQTLAIKDKKTVGSQIIKLKMELSSLLVISDTLSIWSISVAGALTQQHQFSKVTNFVDADIFFTANGSQLQVMQLGSLNYAITFYWQDISGNSISTTTANLHVFISTDLAARDFQILGTQGILIYNKQSNQRRQFSASFNFTFVNSSSFSVQYLESLSFVAFGQNPVVKLYNNSQGEIFILSTSTNGFCQTAVEFNNNDWPKCAYQNYFQFESLWMVDYAMNYFWGRLNDLQTRINQFAIVNACDSLLYAGKYGNGKVPSITLRTTTNGYFEAIVLHEYVNYQDQPTQTKLYCGSSGLETFASPSIELVSFKIVDFDQFTYK